MYNQLFISTPFIYKASLYYSINYMSIDVSLQWHSTRSENRLNLSIRHLISLIGTVKRVFGVQCGKSRKHEKRYQCHLDLMLTHEKLTPFIVLLLYLLYRDLNVFLNIILQTWLIRYFRITRLKKSLAIILTICLKNVSSTWKFYAKE